jgi:hypothetical protein
MGLPPNVNQLVTAIQGAPAAGAAAAPGPTTPSTAATSTSQLITFTGYLGPTIGSPGGQPWRLLYLDLRMECWLLIEESGIVDAQTVRDDEAPSGKCDVIWVKADAAVGAGRGSLSDEARFLTGQFTRAGDSETSWTGGTHTATTGVFCGASTVTCCRRASN